MRLRLIQELFDGGQSYQWTSQHDAKFTVGDAHYEMQFSHYNFGKWRGTGVDFSLSSPQVYDPYTITGTGNAAAVLGMAVQILRDYAVRNGIQFFYFSAEEQSRLKLYLAMARRLARDWWLISDYSEEDRLTVMFFASKRALPQQESAQQLYNQFKLRHYGQPEGL